MTAREPRGGGAPAGIELGWLDVLKGLAMVGIFLNHLVERTLGYPYIANPDANWPPLAERIAQLRPLHGHGLWDPALNLVRYVGWSGEQGVQLFLVVSGFGLTWGLIGRGGGPLAVGDFYRRRLARLYPQWWGAHLLFALAALLTGWGLSLRDPAFYLSLIGFRATPHMLYYFSPAWWYVGLVLQLYAVYPLLWAGLRRVGPWWLLVATCLVGFAARAAGLLSLHGYLDAWQRGAVFVTRLPEFALGMSLAAWMHADPGRADRTLRSARGLAAAAASYLLGTLLSLTLPGMTVAPFLLGAGAFGLLYAALGGTGRARPARRGLWSWVGRHSYAIFLVHHPFILRLVPKGGAHGLPRVVAGTAAAIVLTVLGTLVLEWLARAAEEWWGRRIARAGAVRTILRLALAGVACFALLVAAELLVRRVAPQEVPEEGWGERASLEPDSVFGWRLRPSRETRLRWESYDYRVVANSLGFPGPEYRPGREPAVLRILATGDAFTSAEGVDTDRSWPRLLEADLRGRLPGRRVEVMDFAITGYGPNQYLAVVRAFAPRYRPDVIVVESFVNDYQDVMVSDSAFRASIGFDLPAPGGWRTVVRLSHLRTLLRLEVGERLTELLRRRPRPEGYFLGNFAALERHRRDQEPARQRMADRLGGIKALADSLGAKVLIALVPAPVQACPPARLAYYPRHVDLSDSTLYDLDLPQRTTRAIADSLGIPCVDLRPAVVSVPAGGAWQPRNMHWTLAGHEAVAHYLARVLITGGYAAQR